MFHHAGNPGCVMQGSQTSNKDQNSAFFECRFYTYDKNNTNEFFFLGGVGGDENYW